MDVLLKFLRAQCCHCYRFRLRRVEIEKVTAKLRLLQFRLLDAAAEIDNLDISAADDSDDEQDDQAEKLSRVISSFVTTTLQNHHRVTRGDVYRVKHEGSSQMRRDVISNFMKVLTSGSRICATCKGLSPTYRKDGFVKIFQKPLSSKEKAKLAQGKFKLRDALTLKQKGSVYTKEDETRDSTISDAGSTEASEDDQVPEGSLDADGDVEMQVSKVTKKSSGAGQKYLSPAEVKARIEFLFEKEQSLLTVLYSSRPLQKGMKPPFWAGSFFIDSILVPPNKFRPEAKAGGKITEAQQNTLFSAILNASLNIADIHRGIEQDALDNVSGRKDISMFLEAWGELQKAVNSLIDSSKNPSRQQEDGIKQKLEKKEGLFRTNMMGKRVNYAARSVISPDPNIETNEIGVPPVFARKLTFPEPVTSHNFLEMQRAVINGPEVWPGASHIQKENGQLVNLARVKPDERMALANELLAPSNSGDVSLRNKKVYRHLANGDVVLMNRQPTLHKPSIMAHRVRVLPGEKTIRMHYANCNTYNADFDGDEMNMHFPQTELARAEALNIADTDHQYLSGTQGKPLRGLIQDHLSVSVSLCNKDTFFTRGDYQQLLYAAIRPEHGHTVTSKIQLLTPAILKPHPLWTGKQVITTILLNVAPPNSGKLWMKGNSQVKASAWGIKSKARKTLSSDTEPEPDEGIVKFVDGEFIHGILDKAQLGPSNGGLIHAVHEVYGPSVAGKLLGSIGRLLTRYLGMRAFSCGMDDLKLTREGEQQRREALKSAADLGLKVAAEFVDLSNQCPTADDPELLSRLEAVMRDDEKQKDLELLLNQRCGTLSTALTQACVPTGLVKQFPQNQMQTMTTSGAKGSAVNANLISSNLGQQVLEGRRVPLMVSGKSLPCFRPFETHIRAGGYIVNRFLTGIRPQEYYFHHMAGREGLIDTAVKTASSGYLQRCLIKGMEGLRIGYDATVRNSDGSLIQFLYGEDGLDPTRVKYLHDFVFTLNNVHSEIAKLQLNQPGGNMILDKREEILKEMKRAIKHASDPDPPVPVNSWLPASRFAYSTSEKFYLKLMSFLKDKSNNLIRDKTRRGMARIDQSISKKAAESILFAKYSRSAVEPGEAVGIVAGQSVGEPSTQMTLNTFHLAGHSAKNVTLGVPRLREILMTNGTSIKKPSMTLFLNQEMTGDDGKQFAKAISVLPLSHVIDKVTITEKISSGCLFSLAKVFDIKLNFFPSENYTEEYAISIVDVLNTVETKLIPKLEMKLKKISKATQSRLKVGESSGKDKVVSRRTVALAEGEIPEIEDDEDGNSDSDDDNGDGDATSAKRKANRSEGLSYGENDEEDDEIQSQNQRELQEADDDMEDEGFSRSPKGQPDEDDDNHLSPGSRDRRERVIDSNSHVSRFSCDEKNGTWAEFTMEYHAAMPKVLIENLVKDSIRTSVIQQIDRIDSCTFVVEDIKNSQTGVNEKVPVVHTAGVNLRAMQNYSEYINPHRTIANDIAAMLEVYGIEACRNTIIQELSGTFGGHGISVDNRHLNMIGDYMTRNGEITPFNRTGLKGNVSPFTKMSFETTVGFLKEAVLEGDWDDLTTPSARIVMGQHSTLGTNSFDVITGVPRGDT